MCGIAGSTDADRETLIALQSRLAHRGPDGKGLWQANPAGRGPGLVHARLAVIALGPDGAQPMTSPDGRYVLSYNGEIFNYRALKAELEAAGERFATTSDTEVLLRLLTQHGTAGLARVNGMFAFALWDRETATLTLGRDRLGIKPLVYAALPGGGLAFASEIAALRAHAGIDTTIDRAALSAYLACLYVPAPATIHAGIRKLPPGHVLVWRKGAFETTAYWTPRVDGTRTLAVEEAVEELLPILRRAVGECLEADVPVGCFLSGGIDSSVIAALAQSHRQDAGAPALQTFTMAFDEAAYDERTQARAIAKQIGSAHTELAARPDLAGRSAALAQAFGEPFGNPTALLVHELSRAAREHVTVALVGDGGDEVFAGYPRYQGLLWAEHYRRVPAWLRRGVVAPLVARLSESRHGHHGRRRLREFVAGADLPPAETYASWVEYFTPEERRQLLGEDTAPGRPIAALYRAATSAHPLDAAQETDLRSFLPGNLLAYGDAMSMAHALELRLPLLDHRLVEAAATLAPDVRMAGGLKGLLRTVAKRLLPPEIASAPKIGFNPPLGLWLDGPLKAAVSERLTPETLADCGLAWAPVAALLQSWREGRLDVSLKVWALYNLACWRDSVR